MPAGNWIMYGPALEQLLDGGLDFDTNSFRMVLVTSSYTPDQANHDTWSDISANEVANGNGYATHGKALTVTTPSDADTDGTIDCDDQTWTSSTITAKYAIIVKDGNADGSLAAGDIPVFYCNLETGGGSVSSTNGSFAITIHANGIYVFTAATS